MKHFRNAALRCVLAALPACSGCASIVNGTTQTVAISSVPASATVSIDGQSAFTTPLSIDLSRKAIHSVKVEKEGYLPYEATITQSTSWWLLGDIPFGIIGILFDAGFGGIYNLSPTDISADLRELPTAQNAPVR